MLRFDPASIVHSSIGPVRDTAAANILGMTLIFRICVRLTVTSKAVIESVPIKRHLRFRPSCVELESLDSVYVGAGSCL